MKNKNTFLSVLNEYFSSYLPFAKGLSKSTITSYKATFRLLLVFMKDVKNISADSITFDILDDKLILEFLDWLEKERGCSKTTRNQRLSAISAFSLYAQNRDFDAASVFRKGVLKVPSKKTASIIRTTFTPEELRIFLSLPERRTETELRDKVLLSFMYASGMRAQEVCDLMVGDIQFDTDKARILIHGKGQKMRKIGIPLQVSSILKRYIVHRGILSNPDRHVFSSQTHEQMTVSCIEEIYKKYTSIAKQRYPDLFREHYTPHSMRHTTATHMIEAGVPLIAVKNFLGHASLQTTQVYVEISQRTLDENLRAWNEKWFLMDELENAKEAEPDNIPDFLK